MLFKKDIREEIRKKILELSSLTKQSLWYTVKYLFDKAEENCKKVLEIEEISDKTNLDVIDTAIDYLNKRCMKGKPLREIIMLMEISAIFERICDLLEKICRLNIIVPEVVKSNIAEKLTWMTKKVITMIEISEDAMKEEDVEELKQNLEGIDDEIDELFLECKKQIIEFLSNGNNVETYANLLYVIGYLERIGDLAAKIGSRLVYIFEGKHIFIK
ncbi:MAG: phosphate uptake regulator PhoU [Candidatus Njordarchaeota archaeon]